MKIYYINSKCFSHRLFGNYEALDGGELSEALEDFSAGVSDTMNMVEMEVATKSEERVALFARMQKDMDRKSLMAASIPVSVGDFFFLFALKDKVKGKR